MSVRFASDPPPPRKRKNFVRTATPFIRTHEVEQTAEVTELKELQRQAATVEEIPEPTNKKSISPQQKEAT